MDENGRNGRPHSIAPYGYRNLHDERTGKFTERVKEPGEAVNIEELFRRIRQGHSFRAIARDWEMRGIRTRTGKPFSPQHLRHLAMNPVTPPSGGIRRTKTARRRMAGTGWTLQRKASGSRSSSARSSMHSAIS